MLPFMQAIISSRLGFLFDSRSISENQDESDIVIDLDEWVDSDESLDTSFDWYEQKFSSNINQLKKWFIDDYCIWNIEVVLQGAEELTDKTKLLLTGP